VPQDIRWGRTYEGYSENTELVTELGAAYLRGLQGDDLASADTILATAKHYLADGGTAFGTSTQEIVNDHPQRGWLGLMHLEGALLLT
jgi:beta-glucosidase